MGEEVGRHGVSWVWEGRWLVVGTCVQTDGANVSEGGLGVGTLVGVRSGCASPVAHSVTWKRAPPGRDTEKLSVHICYHPMLATALVRRRPFREGGGEGSRTESHQATQDGPR
jgi:hypothetical protein